MTTDSKKPESNTAPPSEQNKPRTLKTCKTDWIDDVIQDLCELPDRTSPIDQPELILCSSSEIRQSIEANLPPFIGGE